MKKLRDTSVYRNCGATTKRGTPCRAPAKPGSPYCNLHADPEAARRIAALGGQARGERSRAIKEAGLAGLETPRSITQCIDTINTVFGRLVAQEIEPTTAAAIAIVALARLQAQGNAEVWELRRTPRTA